MSKLHNQAIAVIINLISSDADVRHLCDQLLWSSSPERSMTLQTFCDSPAEPPAGACIYDISGATSADVLARFDDLQTIVIMDRKTLVNFGPEVLLPKCDILLKPLSRARLGLALDRLAGANTQEKCAPEERIDSELEGFVQYLSRMSLQLQELDQDRSHFVARAAHELGNPLTSLAGYCDLMLERRLGPLSGQQETVLSRMRRSVSRLSAIVSSMHQLLSPGQTSTDLPLLSEVSYTDCLERAVQELTPFMVERRMELSLDLAPCSGPVCADPKQMEEVFINVLDNSCRFTPRGGMLKISGYPFHHTPGGKRLRSHDSLPMPNAYRVDISDNGAAIEPDRLDRIFDGQMEVRSGNRAGFGLRLAICKLIVERHRGWIWAESAGQHTTFSIVLPLG